MVNASCGYAAIIVIGHSLLNIVIYCAIIFLCWRKTIIIGILHSHKMHVHLSIQRLCIL